LSPTPTPIVIEIRVHAGSDTYNSVHGNIERAVKSALQSVGFTDPQLDMVLVNKGDRKRGMGRIVLHQRIIEAGTEPIIAAGERTEDMEERIERALRKIIGDMPSVRFVHDAMPPYRSRGYEQMKPFYTRPPVARNPAAHGRQAVARM
jgi:hypothetical protein